MRSYPRFILSFALLVLGWQLLAPTLSSILRAEGLDQSSQATATDAKDKSNSDDDQVEEPAAKEKQDKEKEADESSGAKKDADTGTTQEKPAASAASKPKPKYPPFDEVLATCREMRASTLTLLGSFADEDLDKAGAGVPAGYEDTFGTRRLCFQYVSDHWYMHRGHLADARRAAGLQRMWV